MAETNGILKIVRMLKISNLIKRSKEKIMADNLEIISNFLYGGSRMIKKVYYRTNNVPHIFY